jgi:hypothetical protein
MMIEIILCYLFLGCNIFLHFNLFTFNHLSTYFVNQSVREGEEHHLFASSEEFVGHSYGRMAPGSSARVPANPLPNGGAPFCFS